MNTRKYSRTMQGAFGPHTPDRLEPMPEDVQERAKELIKRMADTWADRNLDEVLA